MAVRLGHGLPSHALSAVPLAVIQRESRKSLSTTRLATVAFSPSYFLHECLRNIKKNRAEPYAAPE
eukprot:1059828-Pleurochrysis_carterae.AAC.1